MKRITISIDEKGDVQMQTSGYAGGECTKEVEKLNQGLAAAGFDVKTTGIKYTDEYYAQKQTNKVTA